MSDAEHVAMQAPSGEQVKVNVKDTEEIRRLEQEGYTRVDEGESRNER